MLGIASLGGLCIWLGSQDLGRIINRMSIYGVIGWISTTLIARVALAALFSLFIGTVGSRVSIYAIFALNWLQSFFNQLLPLSGLAFSATFLRQRAKLNWSQIAACTTPQFLTAAFTIGIMGCLSTLLNTARLQTLSWPTAGIFTLMASISVAILFYAPSISFPSIFEKYIGPAQALLAHLQTNRRLLMGLISLQLIALLMRAARLWILFTVSGIHISPPTILCLSTIADIAFLIQLTPGGMGLREGALIVGAAMLGLNIQSATAVALMDRFLIILLVLIMTPLSLYKINSGPRPWAEATGKTKD